MRTYQNIYLTFGEVFQQGRGLFARFGTSEIIHPHGHILQTGGEGTEMLIGKHRRWHQHSHLFTVGSSLEGSTHRYLGLTEAHITTHQTVHRLGHLHIGLHVLRGLQLIRRILIKETGLEFMLQVGVGTEGETLLTTTLGVEFDQVAGDVLDMFLRALLQFLPLACAKGGETRRLTIVLRLVFRDLI